jgi:sterol desaturase/sphingolipid hydroxylase (fatty acid hydroxylase superfamily)
MDLTVAAIPIYFGTMGAEYAYLRSQADPSNPKPAEYTKLDTVASLSMGVGSLVVPLVMPKLLGPITPGKGKYGKALVLTAAGAAAVATAVDAIRRSSEPPSEDDVEGSADRFDGSGGAGSGRAGAAPAGAAPVAASRPSVLERIGGLAGAVAVAAGGVAITTTLASKTAMNRMWRRRVVRDLGAGPAALAAAVLLWDFIYYWNHRFMHESRFLWAIHVVHHSSEHYNLSTALRQPVADAFGTFLPYSALAALGIRPELIESARGINLLYQYWIHTDTIRKLGPFEKLFNTPSHHRVHHGSNRQYIDRNHGSILILWDRLFGTFEEEREPVVYGLTKNIDTYNPSRIASHEHADMLRDVAQSRSWKERLSYVVRGPGWAYQQHAARREAERPSVEPLAAMA